MFDWLKNIIAKFKLGCFLFNDNESDSINDILDRFMALQWVDVKIDDYYIVVTTSNQRQIGVWNANRYYGFASRGYVRDINDGNELPILYSHHNIYNWDNCRPSVWRMVAFLEKVSNFDQKTVVSRELAEREAIISRIFDSTPAAVTAVEETEIIKETLKKL